MEFPTAVEVEGAEDTQPPKLIALEIEPSSIDTSAAKQLVTLNAHLTDNLSGVQEATAAFVSPSGEQKVIGSFSLSSGTATDGSFEAPATFPQFSEAGIWQIAYINLRDQANNFTTLSTEDLQAMEFPTAVEVEGAEDTQPPKLIALEIEPSSIDTSAAKQLVTLNAHLTDNLSGVQEATAAFVSPSGEQKVIGSFSLSSGTATDGSFEAPATFPQFSEAGIWQIAYINLRDQANNFTTLSTEDLQAMEFPTAVEVGAVVPTVAESAPGSGPEAGGTEVQISGTGFTGASEVRFGATPALEFTVKSSTSITAVSPPGSGTVDVTVTTAGGTSATGPEDRFQYSPPVSLASSPNPSVHGSKVTFTANVTPEASEASTPLGTVSFVEGSNTIGVANLKKGTATLNVTSLGAGKHQVIAVYSGDSSYGPGESNAVDQIVSKADTDVALVSSLNPASYATHGTLKATVKAVAPGAGTPAGTVTFSEGAAVLSTVQLNGASATFSLKTLEPGEHEIAASYSGDANNEGGTSPPVTQTIVKATTETVLTSTLNPAPYGSSGTLKATVDAIAPSVGTPVGTVTFLEGETELATVPLSGSVAKYPLKSVSPGSYEITAVYKGSSNYEASEAEIGQVVTQAATDLSLTSTLNPAPYGSSATLKASVKAVAPGAGTPPGSVTFREGSTVLATVPLSGTTAKFALKTMGPGSHEITATYSGDSNYEPSEASLSQEIVKASTDLIVTSTKNPAPLGASGTIKATVKAVAPGGGTPPGTVTFREGEAVLATVPLSSKTATYPLKLLSAGSHEVTATYSGSGDYEASEGAITQVITP